MGSRARQHDTLLSAPRWYRTVHALRHRTPKQKTCREEHHTPRGLLRSGKIRAFLVGYGAARGRRRLDAEDAED